MQRAADSVFWWVQKKNNGCSVEFFTRYHKAGEEFLTKIVISDETWLHYYQPETKVQSMVWKSKGIHALTKFKRERSAGIVQLTVFWESEEVIDEEYLLKSTRTNADMYAETFFNLWKAIEDRRAEKLSRGIILLHDNARSHIASLSAVFREDFKSDVPIFTGSGPFRLPLLLSTEETSGRNMISHEWWN